MKRDSFFQWMLVTLVFRMKSKIYFVTGNKHKFAEVKPIIESHLPLYELLQSNEPLQEIQADSLEDVAQFKVNSVKDKIPGEYFIEDAGFFVDDLIHGFPGVYSSYVMKTIGWQGILRILGQSVERKAHFESVIAFFDHERHIHFFKGTNEGHVAMEAKGTSGFGFDPIFLSNDSPSKTFAELSLDQKNQISHRSRAMQKFLSFLKTR